jgi:hypothetical protein
MTRLHFARRRAAHSQQDIGHQRVPHARCNLRATLRYCCLLTAILSHRNLLTLSNLPNTRLMELEI